MKNYNNMSELDYYITHPREIDNYAKELVNVLCKQCKRNAERKEELLHNMIQLLSSCVMSCMLYDS